MPNQTHHLEAENLDTSKRDLLQELVEIYQRLGRPPTVEEVEEYGEHPYKQYRKAFGDLFTALKAAAILDDSATRSEYVQMANIEDGPPTADIVSVTTTPSDATTSRESPSRRELLDELKRIDDSLDRIPYPADIDKREGFTAYAFRQEFGSWDDALEAAGIDKETELLEDMQQVVTETGERITKSAMNEHGRYSASMASRFFGSWSAAKERFDAWKRAKQSKTDDTVATSALADDMEQAPAPQRFRELTGFQRDLLYVTAGLGTASGLTLKAELEEEYETEIHHGRLYPNLDALVEEGLIEKESVDQRTNGYSVTPAGQAAIETRRMWENTQLLGQDDSGSNVDGWEQPDSDTSVTAGSSQLDEQPDGVTRDQESTKQPAVDQSADIDPASLNRDITRMLEDLLSLEDETDERVEKD